MVLIDSEKMSEYSLKFNINRFFLRKYFFSCFSSAASLLVLCVSVIDFEFYYLYLNPSQLQGLAGSSTFPFALYHSPARGRNDEALSLSPLSKSTRTVGASASELRNAEK